MDKLKEFSVELGGTIQAQKFSSANFEGTSFRKLIVKDYQQYHIKIDEYSDLWSVGIEVQSDLGFSINKPDRIFLYKIPKQIADLPYKVYVSEATYDFYGNTERTNFIDSLVTFIKKIALSAKEAIFIYNNFVIISLALERDVKSVLDDVIDLLNGHEKVFKKEVRRRILSKNIPDDLRKIIPLLKKYSVSDDAEREQLIASMTEADKAKLINAVQPFFEEIDMFLNSFGERPLSEEAMAIGELGELVRELQTGLIKGK